MKTIKVLHIAISSNSGAFGGVEKFMTDYYSHTDHNRFCFDFILCRENSLASVVDQEYMKGSSVKALHVLKDQDNSFLDFYRLYKMVLAELKNKHYDIIHIETSFAPVQIACLWAAKKNRNKIRIAHSHSSGRESSGNVIRRAIKGAAYSLSKIIVRNLATDYLACSVQAGISLFGRKGVCSERFRIIKNAIDADRYRYSVDKRNRIRAENDVNEGCVVFGCVGRLDPIKCIPFAIDVFREFHDTNPNSKMWIIGDGPQKKEILHHVNQNRLSNSVRIFGQRNDVPDLMQGIDVLLFPSKHEGLGISAIEAQACGLPVFASDGIPVETSITKLISHLSRKEGTKRWSDMIGDFIKDFNRYDTYPEIMDSGYDITVAAKGLENFYEKKMME